MTKLETSFSYFVIAIDYGTQPRNGLGPYGVEAIVDPEMTRRGAIAKVREILGDGKEIAFAHYITMNDAPEDVLEELKAEAFKEAFIAAGERLFADQLAFERDHARDLRKHAERV